MNKVVTVENLHCFAYVNDKVCARPIKGVALSFVGLGCTEMHNWDFLEGEFFGKHNVIYIIPYTNPWSWMNRPTVDFVDEVVDAVFEKFSLAPDTPVVSSGGSMGGQSALVYSAYSKRTPVACVTDCAVCDVAFHYTERDDLPRTMYSAVCHMDGNVEDALKTISPLHLVDKMPKIPYHIMHCSKDAAVNINSHSGKFVAKMREKGHTVTYDVIEGRGHCDLDYDGKKKYAMYIVDAVNNK